MGSSPGLFDDWSSWRRLGSVGVDAAKTAPTSYPTIESFYNLRINRSLIISVHPCSVTGLGGLVHTEAVTLVSFLPADLGHEGRGKDQGDDGDQTENNPTANVG